MSITSEAGVTPESLPQLQAELAAAGIVVRGLTLLPDGTLTAPDEDGVPQPLPPEADPIVAAHVPDPPPGSIWDLIAELYASIDTSGDEAMEELVAVNVAQAALLKEGIGG